MRPLRIFMAATALGACGPRLVEVRTAPAVESTIALDVTNTLSSAVNVYVVRGTTEMFVGQVPANTASRRAVQGIPSGSTVTLKAVTTDGSRVITTPGVLLTGTVPFSVK